MRTILITGAGGFLGRHAAKYFTSHEYHVIGLGRTQPSDDTCSEWGIADWVTADLTSEWDLPTGYRPDAIVHCAGSSDVGRSAQFPLEDFRDSVLTLEMALEYCRRQEYPCDFVYPSSAAVYGSVDHLPISESDDLQPISVYGVNKLICEQLVKSYSTNFGLRSAIIRFFSVYGIELRKQIFWDACRKAVTKDPKFFGTGQETRDFLHIEDAVALLGAALRNVSEKCPIRNGGSGDATRISDLVTSLFVAIGAEIEPGFARTDRRGDPKDYLADTHAVHEWGWKATRSLEYGIAQYVNWFKNLEIAEKTDP